MHLGCELVPHAIAGRNQEFSYWGTMAGDAMLPELLSLMDIADGVLPGKSVVHGRVYEPKSRKMIMLPVDATQPTKPLRLGQHVAADLLKLGSIDGIKYGNSVDRIAPIPQCQWGVMFIWHRNNRRFVQGRSDPTPGSRPFETHAEVVVERGVPHGILQLRVDRCVSDQTSTRRVTRSQRHTV